MIMLCNTLPPNDRVQAKPAVFGRKRCTIPIIDKTIEVDVAPTIPIESTDSISVFRVL